MKELPRGPFSRLRWFCADGTVHPPRPYPCEERGGGVQHGEYSDTTQEIREAGYPIANLLIETDPDSILQSDGGVDRLAMILLEQFLIGYDDGWIFRQARFYRGAVQVEDEERAGQELLEHLASDTEWLEDRFLVLREAARLLPHERGHQSLGKIRGLAAAIADQDPDFRALRGKIHGRPDAGDAERVREYARKDGEAELASQYRELAERIDLAYRTEELSTVLERIANIAGVDELETSISALNRRLVEATRARSKKRALTTARLEASATASALIRAHLSDVESPADRVALLDASLELERIAFVHGQELAAGAASAPRLRLLGWLEQHARALYGAGLLSAAEMRELKVTLDHIDDEPVELKCYRHELDQLARVSRWAGNRLLFHFGDPIARFADLEPKVEQFVPDRLRGSQLLPFDATHEVLAVDAQVQSSVHHEVFGRRVGRGLRSLNPGLARGTLYVATHETPLDAYDADGIYLVPETLAMLPPVAGVLTRSEGNALSHVQLLARNLGIPNIVVSTELADQLVRHAGESVVIAASRGGVVQIARDSFEWDNVFRAGEEAERAPLRVDLAKLDLTSTEPISLRQLRARDSGRVAGPKAAKLGELMHRFPGQVAPGVVIPFGVYNQLLQQPVGAGQELTMIEWMERRYNDLEHLRETDVASYRQELTRSLRFLREWFETVSLPEGLEHRLRDAMEQELGAEGTYGVFVRSDTNVEDLEGFTGAGLNLTVHNVVGFDAILNAVRRVWASPFTERAFGWRQSLMDHPEHVYASVLLQVGVPAERSGVLVTKDLETGRDSRATVVVNQGVGGGVDGQRAETLMIELGSDRVRRRSSATASKRRVLLSTGGTALERASATGALLTAEEISALRELARMIPERVPEFAPPRDGREPLVADVEFGFVEGHLWLFQIRPLVDDGGANRSDYLNALDAGLRRTAHQIVDLDARPEVAS